MSEEDEYLAGLREFAAATGQVECVGGHEDWWLGAHRCPWNGCAL